MKSFLLPVCAHKLGSQRLAGVHDPIVQESLVRYGSKTLLVDRRKARYLNTNLSDHLVAANADAGSIEVEMIDEEDLAFNPLGEGLES